MKLFRLTTPLAQIDPLTRRECALVSKRGREGLSEAEQAELKAIYDQVGVETPSEAEIDELAHTHDLPRWQADVLAEEHDRITREEAERALRDDLRRWNQMYHAAEASEARSEGRLLRKPR